MHPAPSSPIPSSDDLILIVVGAHLAAERHDRATAARLAEAVAGWMHKRPREPDGPTARTPLVCTDLWYLNDDSLRACPTVSIGGPEVNALTAYLADKLPSVFAVDGSLVVQMDPEMGDDLAACWGADHGATARAVDIFIARYMDTFLRNAGGVDAPGT